MALLISSLEPSPAQVDVERVNAEFDELQTVKRHRWMLTPLERATIKRRVFKLCTSGSTEMIQLTAARLLTEMASHDQDDQHHIEGSKVAVTHEHRTPEQIIAALRLSIERKMGRVGSAGRESRLIEQAGA